jgi:hypothetical protein
MKSIGQFINDVELPDGLPSLVDWDRLLEGAGYCGVPISTYAHWRDVMVWCNEVVGEDHYTWTGYTLWFESTEMATLFALRWS